MNIRKLSGRCFSLVLCFASLSLFSCGGKSASTENAGMPGENLPRQKEGGKMVYGFATELNNFDPFSSMTAEARAVNFNIFDGLVNVSTDGSFLPALAESYAVSPDADDFIFFFRKLG